MSAILCHRTLVKPYFKGLQSSFSEQRYLFRYSPIADDHDHIPVMSFALNIIDTERLVIYSIRKRLIPYIYPLALVSAISLFHIVWAFEEYLQITVMINIAAQQKELIKVEAEWI